MKRLANFTAFFVIFSGAVVFAEDNWSQYRGPSGTGHSADPDIPITWTAEDIAWSTKLSGIGQSSVVNFGAQLFVTSASPEGDERYVECLDRDSGEILWTTTIPTSSSEPTHKMNTRATPTCAVDAERVIAFFGPAGLHCFDHNGETLWQRTDLGDFPSSWGVGASPIIHEGKVILNCDATGPSRLVAFSLTDGSTVWETQRLDKPKGGWSTPILIDTGEREELVLNGEFSVRAYDPATGAELWYCTAFTGRGAPMPEFAQGKLFVINGKRGDTYCVTPGGSGDVTETHRIWHSPRKGGRDLPSPAVVGDFLAISSMSAVATVYDTENGDPLWTDRLGPSEIVASPLVADTHGLIYWQGVYGGEVVVMRPGAELEIVARNSIGVSQQEAFRSDIAPIGGKLYLRSESAVYCIAP